ncbi:MAG: hypothetical protein Q9168_005785 [Polycauliona sp. 1 TL-2023]
MNSKKSNTQTQPMAMEEKVRNRLQKSKDFALPTERQRPRPKVAPPSLTRRVFRRLGYGLLLFYGGLGLMSLYGSEEAPITGRRRLRFDQSLTPRWLMKIAKEELKKQDPRQTVEQQIMDTDHPLFQEKIRSVPNPSMSDDGHIKIYTGIFHAARDEDEIAAILSHQIASMIAGHKKESLSGAEVGAIILLPFWPIFAGFMYFDKPLGPVFDGIGYYPMKLSTDALQSSNWRRVHEADYIGMLLMAKAGFDPKGAISVIQNRIMAKRDREKPDPGSILEGIETFCPDVSAQEGSTLWSLCD